MAFATALADILLEQFEDRQQGGFFFTSNDHESLIHRPKPGQDNATPSGNGVAAFALQRLGHLLGEQRHLDASERTLRLFYPAMAEHPAGFMSLLAALQEHLAAPSIVILRGDGMAMAVWQQALLRSHLPGTMVLALPSGIQNLPAALNKPVSGDVTAWVCQGSRCLPAMHDLQDLIQACQAAQ